MVADVSHKTAPSPVAIAYLTLLLTAIATGGSLFLSLGMGLRACPLCFYQRTFVMSAFAVLALCLWNDRSRPGFACFLALPLIWAGLGVALFHEYLVLSGDLECPPGVLGLGTAPAQSLAILALLAATCTVGTGLRHAESNAIPFAAVIAAIVLGLLLAAASVASSPPLPPVPTAPYDLEKQPLNTCRPPFHSQ